MIENRERLEHTISKYRKNKMYVAEEDLKGKFKEPFDALKRRMAWEAEQYLIEYCILAYGKRVRTDQMQEFKEVVDIIYGGYKKKLSEALMRDLEGDQFFVIADKLRLELKPIVESYSI